jgi:ectoine hydroxylase-related dioxygenase (phytanoyl-CoA dioxygenase family)
MPQRVLFGKLKPMALETDVAGFWKRGYVILRGAFQPDEMAVMRKAVTSNVDMSRQVAQARAHSTGGRRPSFDTIFVWNDTAGDDLFAKATRSHKIIERLEAIFDDEVYVYHNKVALKYPGVVGFSYHQDYAYWYEMGNLWPDMATAFIAIDRATRANGCLKLLEGSHKLGRVTHTSRGPSDSGADPKRLAFIQKALPEIAIELDVGDAVIFHANVLHASDDNRSTSSRMALLGCYNTKHNDPVWAAHGHPNYHPQTKIYDPITADDLTRLPAFKQEEEEAK